MAGKQQQQQEHTDVDYLILFVGIIIAIALAWFFLGKYLMASFFFMRDMELRGLNYITSLFGLNLSTLDLLLQYDARVFFSKFYSETQLPKGEIPFSYLQVMLKWASNPTNADNLSWAEFRYVLFESGHILRFVYTPILLGIAVYSLFKVKGEGFKTSYDLDRFIEYQAKEWGVIKPAINVLKRHGQNKTALKPFYWMDKHKVTLKDGNFDDEKAEKIFMKQLGKRVNGFKNAPLHMKVLMFSFILNAARDKNNDKFKSDMAEIFLIEDQKIKTEKLRELIKPYLSNKKYTNKILQFSKKHAYYTTLLVAMLVWARKKGGTYPPAQFVWLKGVDRTLWYALNNVGRYKFFIEGAGIISHYQAEVVSRTPLIEPYMESAIEGLENYIEEQGVLDLEAWFQKEKELNEF